MANNKSNFLLLLAIVLIAVVAPSADSVSVNLDVGILLVEASLPINLGLLGPILEANVSLTRNGSVLARANRLVPGIINLVTTNLTPINVGSGGLIPIDVSATVRLLDLAVVNLTAPLRLTAVILNVVDTNVALGTALGIAGPFVVIG
ncbi:OLC1v1009117C1 [Oldenlandia corymbosa var. corymbosa]|uniref:OLC1v1009117C1 n=1 Tax=Oldenlandia corymbosa var. corymbosa TaxID=529605 RepID=A0AAV1DNF0_OLDCO|nr:OLC1v1009117C1 [Oldenlandia corymbosa var. corymbosa]